jgi:bifunctional non-homologous end joining protein LigD
MEPVLSREPITGTDYVYQVKWDGIRILANIVDGQVTLHTRHGKVRTTIYPEITAILASNYKKETLYLDGEMISLFDGKPDFFQVVKRDRIKTPSKIEQFVSKIPVSYVIFDMVKANERWLLDMPLEKRLALLEKYVSNSEKIQLCPTTENGESLFTYTKEKHWEGIVAKEKQGKYHIGQKHPTWRKIKHFQFIDAYLLGVTLKSGTVYSLLLGVEDGNQWRYIGRVSTGLSVEEKQLLTTYSSYLATPTAATHIPPFREEEIRWFTPSIKAKIRYLEWTPDEILRNPVIESFQKEKST